MVNRERIKWLLFTAMYVALIWSLEMLLVFIPNIQLTTLLIVVYVVNHKYKQSLVMIIAYVILDNLAYGFSIFMLPMFLGWMFIPTVYAFIRPTNEYQHAALGILFGLIYSWMFIPLSVVMYGIPFKAYIIADIPFEIILCTSNVVTILWLYKPIEKILTYYKDGLY